MSQLVLARKYRPQKFAHMVGQDHVVQALTNALRTGRLHHAFMFTGTRGVGKTTVSRILAKSLNCIGPDGTGGITAEPCGVCPACTDINLGRFVDYTELDAASNRGVDEVQSLLEQAVYKPVQGRFKVFMIDEVHMLTGHAFNAMLKTLEEPPDYLKFVLATTDPQKVPVTVLSRCLQFNLRPMAPQTVLEHLSYVMTTEGLDAQPAALSLLAKGARGSMRDALSLLDQAIAYGGVGPGVALSEATVRHMVSAADTGQVMALLHYLAATDGPGLVAQCDQLRANGLSAGACLDELIAVLQRVAVVQAGAHKSVNTVDPDQEQVRVLASQLPGDVVHLLYSLVLQGRGDLALAPDEHDALLMLMLRALVFMPGGSPRAQMGAVGPHDGTKAVAVAVVSANSSEQDSRTANSQPPDPEKQVAHPVEIRTHTTAVVMPADETHALEPRAEIRQLAVRVAPNPSEKTDRLKSLADRSQALGKPELVLTELGDFWFDKVQALLDKELVNALARELALQSQLIGRESFSAPQATEHWHLRVERESLCQSTHRERLEAALQLLGHPVALTLEVGMVADSCAKRVAARRAEIAARAIECIQNDDFVRELEKEFGAKLLHDTIEVHANTDRPRA